MRTNHQTTALQKPLSLHDSSVAIAPSSSLRSGHLTGGHLAHFVALIRPNLHRFAPQTSDTHQTLYEMSIFKGVKIKNAPKRFNISRLAGKNKR